jgi:putative ABC transport system ATP-binding protein
MSLEQRMQTVFSSSPKPPAAFDDASPLSAQSVGKSFVQGETRIAAVKDVSLSVKPGELVAVMGPSGSGKSTLLHLLAGLTAPDSGRVLVDGQDLATLSDGQLTRFRRRKIGLVFQAYNLIPTLSAEDNIRLPATGADGLDGRIGKLLDDLGLASRRHHRPDALSGGEQQRVAIARALVNEPAVILADEPTGGLDSTTGQSICLLLRELCDLEGRSIIIVTHEPTVASWAQRVVVLKDGRQISAFQTDSTGDGRSLQASYQDAVRGNP